MTATALIDDHAIAIAPDTIRIERLLPGPIERVWSYLTQGELRRRWLAAGDMDLHPGASFTLTWRNDELTDPPGIRPVGMSEEHSATCTILAIEARRCSATHGRTWVKSRLSCDPAAATSC